MEVDLMDPKLDVKEVSISFVADEGNDFVNFLCQPGYHVCLWDWGVNGVCVSIPSPIIN